MVTAALIFAEPLWLGVIPLLAVGGYFLGALARKRAEQKIALFVSAGLVKDAIAPLSSRPRRLRFAIPLAVAMLLVIAAARPLTGPRPDHADRKGVDFVVALDVSKSMWAEDVAPYRLAAVKKELSEWLKTMTGDRMGLVLFAGDAIIQAPITFDYQALDRVLQEASPKAVSKGGTNIGQSIEMATTLLKKSGLDTRALVIVTDGENLDGDAISAARTAHEKDGLTIFTVGVGSAAGSKVPIAEPNPAKEPKGARRSYLRNEYGTDVLSQLDERALRAVATAGGGVYEPFQPGQQFFPRFRDSHLLSLSKNRKILNVQDYYEWFQLPVALAILLLMLEPRLTRWRRPSTDNGVGVPVLRPETTAQPAGAPVKFARKAARPKVSVPVILFLLLVQACFAGDALQDKVQNLLKEKKNDEAIALVKAQVDKQPDDAMALYNYGLTLYQAGRYEDAIAAFQDIQTTGTTDENLRTQALFQLGNAQFRLGGKLGTQPAAALSMERALAFYDQLLAIKSTADGKHNREATVQSLEKILRVIADDRIKSANEQVQKNDPSRLSATLKEAVDALDRMAALDPDNKALTQEAAKVHQRLADALLADAARLNAETDKQEAAAANDPKKDRGILDRRNQAIDIDKQALTHSPDDPRIPAAIKEQQNKMADLLAKRAEEKLNPVLGKKETDGKDLAPLEGAHNDLQAALDIAPDHAKANELKAKTDKLLEDLLVKKAEGDLAAAESNKTNPRSQLSKAMQASESFQKAQAVNPDSQRAKAGMEKLQDLLPKAHAAVAALDMAEGKKLMGGDKADDLKKAIGNLETAAQNYGRAVEMAPADTNFQKGLAEAQQLLSESREALDKSRKPQTASAEPGQPDDGGSAEGQSNAPGTQVYAPRQSPGPPTVTSGAFWNKKTRDW